MQPCARDHDGTEVTKVLDGLTYIVGIRRLGRWRSHKSDFDASAEGGAEQGLDLRPAVLAKVGYESEQRLGRKAYVRREPHKEARLVEDLVCSVLPVVRKPPPVRVERVIGHAVQKA